MFYNKKVIAEIEEFIQQNGGLPEEKTSVTYTTKQGGFDVTITTDPTQAVGNKTVEVQDVTYYIGFPITKG